jgi:hypothetical protein
MKLFLMMEQKMKLLLMSDGNEMILNSSADFGIGGKARLLSMESVGKEASSIESIMKKKKRPKEILRNESEFFPPNQLRCHSKHKDDLFQNF